MLLRIGLMALSLTLDVWMRDEPPYDDSHLIPVRRELADEDNAYSLLEQAWKTYTWPDWEVGEERLSFFYDEVPAFGHPDWDFEFVEGLLADNAETLKLFEAGVQKGKLQAPEVKSIDSLLPYLSPWRQLAVLSKLRAAHLYNTGHHQEAFQHAVNIVRFGSMIESSEGPLITLLVGTACKNIGLESLRGILPALELPAEELKTAVQELEQYFITTEAAEIVCKTEFVIGMSAFKDLSAEIKAPFHFKPNKTKRLFGETIEIMIHNMTHNAAQRAHASEELAATFDAPHMVIGITEGGVELRPSEPSAVLNSNAVGKAMLGLVCPSYGGVAFHKCRTEIILHTTRLLIALKAYKLDHGELPGALDALVPEYINAVPIDDFDGRPLRYDRNQRIIYSVGENLEDDGGNEKDDIVTKIDF